MWPLFASVAILGGVILCYVHRTRIITSVAKRVIPELLPALVPTQGVSTLLGKTAAVKSTLNGQDICVYVPYDSRSSVGRDKEVVALRGNGESLDITQAPGFKYLVNARMLGYDDLIIRDVDNPSTIIHLGSEKVPFCTDIQAPDYSRLSSSMTEAYQHAYIILFMKLGIDIPKDISLDNFFRQLVSFAQYLGANPPVYPVVKV